MWLLREGPALEGEVRKCVWVTPCTHSGVGGRMEFAVRPLSCDPGFLNSPDSSRAEPWA